ncbi:MAG: gliding motility-associated C-terminal domain-containing protein [Pricia sp.]
MTNQKFPKAIFKWLTFFCVLILAETGYSQCAGSNGTVTVCEKDADSANETFHLFPHLQGTPSPGGTWSTNDPANFFALDRNTGIVNLWEVKNSDLHQFIYTNSACGESATVSVSLGGYPGEDNTDGSADACGGDPRVNLHRYIGNQTDGKFQDFNGTWTADTPGADEFLTDNYFNALAAGIGTYEFTHTVPAVATCPSREVNLVLEVQRPANSGIGRDLELCISDDLSGRTNFDLNSLLTDEDSNGTWSEVSGTNQLSDLTDQFIDIQEIRDVHRAGTYTFVYTVFPGHPVCEKDETPVDIVILPSLHATMFAPNYCLGLSEYTVEITQYDQTLIDSGTYIVDYSLSPSGSNPTTVADLILRNDGTGQFIIDADEVAVNRNSTLTISSVGPDICTDIRIPPISFAVTDPSAAATSTCEEEDVTVILRNIFDSSVDQANGSYDVTYTLTAPSNTASTFTLEDVFFSSGIGSFSIPASQITETGEYALSFEVASGFDLDCDIETTVEIIARPSEIDLDILVDNNCNATLIDVMVDAPALADGSYSIVYDVTRQDTGEVVIDNAIDFAGGTASYDLDVASLEQGNYTVSVRSTQDDTTACRVEFDFEETENFAIEGVPALPEAEAQQTFCLSAFALDTPTLADISVTANGQIMFYATATDMDILPLDTALVDGEDYFISNIDPNNNCEGSDRIQVTVTLSDPQMPTASNANPVFCDADNPTVADLNASISGGITVVWFEMASGGTALENNSALIDGKSYYAATEDGGQCLSSQRLEIVPTVYALEPASLQFANLALCGLDNPTIGDLRDAEGDNPYEVLWYDTAENGTPLPDAFLLTNNTVYFAESFNPDTGCINPERMAIMVDLTECAPEDYGFFIPDGFSPNGDGRNDTFFVPNIGVIFPDFTLEILNRYGATLFKGDLNRPAWDGSNGSGTAPNGVYFYIINYNKEGHEPIQGRLYLNR